MISSCPVIPGEVYEAQDTELDRTVALKFLPTRVAEDPQRLERFRREAKALAALDHPNIVTIYGIEEAEGRRFLIMERVEGKRLDTMLSRGGLPLTQFFDMALPMVDALAAAHEKGIVHRDLKPANAMMTEDGRVKLLDFGLARLTAEDVQSGEHKSATETTALTGKGAVMGTMPYMSPEQLQGQKIDARTDIFSLGIVLYEILSGTRPFQGDSGVAIASSILKDTPPSLMDIRAALPRALGRIVHDCLEKEPDRRPQTAVEVKNQLEALKRETLSDELRVTPRATTKKWIAAGVSALLIFALGGYFLTREPVPSNRDMTAVSSRPMIVVLPFENLGEAADEYFADGMTEEITSRLAALDGLGVISRTSAMQYKESRPPVREIGEELGVDYVLEGTVRWQRSASGTSEVRVTPQLIRVSEDTHLWAERYDAVLADIFDVQSDIAQQVIERLDIALLEPQRRFLEARLTDNLEAYDFYLRGNDYRRRGRELDSPYDVDIAIEMYDKAVQLDPAFALAYAKQSVAHDYLYSFRDSTQSRLASARAAADRALSLDPDLPEAHLALGRIYARQRESERALEEFQIVLRSQPNNADAFAAISAVHRGLGRYEESLETSKKAAELNPRLGSLACGTGGLFFGLREFSEAIRHHDRAIALTPDRACAYHCKALIHLNWDVGTETARRLLEELPEHIDLEGNPPLNYPWVLVDLMDARYDEALDRLSAGSSRVYDAWGAFYTAKDQLAAQIYGLTNRPELEREHYEAARDLLEAKVEALPGDSRVHSSLGIVYAGLGRREDAVDEGNLGLELLGGRRDDSLGWRIKDLAQIYVMVGDDDAAIDQLEQLLSAPTWFSVGFLQIDPTWDPLREHPRFQALLDEYS